MEAQFKAKHELPIVTRRFKPVAELAIKGMQAALEGGHGRKVYKDYIIALLRYLIPFFGNHHINRIDYPLLRQFEGWRIEKMGKKPKASGIGTHNSALNKVFDEAIERGLISPTQRLELYNRGKAGDPRPAFTIDEYRKLHPRLRSWAEKGGDGKSKDMRLLLRDYLLILANTGMRHGAEAEDLRWKHIRIERNRKTGRSTLLIYVNGKTAGRELLARHNCVTFLKPIHERAEL